MSPTDLPWFKVKLAGSRPNYFQNKLNSDRNANLHIAVYFPLILHKDIFGKMQFKLKRGKANTDNSIYGICWIICKSTEVSRECRVEGK